MADFWVIDYSGSAYAGEAFATRQAAVAARERYCVPSYFSHEGKLARRSLYPVRRAKWTERENARFHDQTYKHPVWAGESFWTLSFYNSGPAASHYAHVALGDPRMIAFTENAEKGEADRQTRMKPGKYLKKFFGDVLSDKKIAFYAEWWTKGDRPVGDAATRLRFAETEEDIIGVYERPGPSSCMKDMDCVRVYAAGDLQVAYLVDEDDEDVVAARALCWPAKEVFGRFYPEDGEGETLFAALRAKGWTSIREDSSAFEGARLLKEEGDDGGWVMPYLDHSYGVRDAGDHFVMSRKNYEIYCDSTSGEIDGPDRSDCDECGARVLSEDTYTVHSGVGRGWAGRGLIGTGEMTWCESCYENGSFYCDALNENFDSATVESVEVGDETWALPYAQENALCCDKTGEWFRPDDAVSMEDGETWSQDAFADHGFTCAHDGENYSRDDESAVYPGYHAQYDDDADVERPQPELLEAA